MNSLEYIINKYNLKVNKHGLTEIPNMKRDDLPLLFHELGFKTGAEIGTAAGVYAETLCINNPGVKLYCVDPWIKHNDFKEPFYAPVLEQYYKDTQNRLAKYDAVLIRDYSRNALEQFEDDSLDFVYIDGNHSLPFVIEDIYYWSKKVRSGGIISGHDYIKPRNNPHQHVIEALQAYTKSYNITPWFVLGLEAKIPETRRDNTRSWMFIKQ